MKTLSAEEVGCVGATFEEGIKACQTLSNAGVTAAKVSKAFRGRILSFSTPSDKAQEAMLEVGMSGITLDE